MKLEEQSKSITRLREMLWKDLLLATTYVIWNLMVATSLYVSIQMGSKVFVMGAVEHYSVRKSTWYWVRNAILFRRN